MHCRTGLEVAEFEEARRHVRISVKESEETVFKFRELFLAGEALIVLNVKVKHMDSFRFEQLT